MKKILYTLLLSPLLIILIGCSTAQSQYGLLQMFSITKSASDIQDMDFKALYSIKNNDLCAAYFDSKSPILHQEIVRRNLIPSNQWDDVNRNVLIKDMPLCAVLASQGKPDGVIMGQKVLELHYNDNTVVLDKLKTHYVLQNP